MMPHELTRMLITSGLFLVPLCGCHSDGNLSPQAPAFTSPAQQSANLQGVSAVQLDEQQKCEIQLALGKTLEGQGAQDRAEAVYRKILKRHPNDQRALHRLAIVCDRQRRFEESEALFRQALKAEPNNSLICGDFGYSLYCQHRWSEAEENLRNAIKLDPENRLAHNHLGLVLAQTQRRNEALANFVQAGCTPAQAYANLGLVAEMNGRFPESQAEYEAASEADPAISVFQRRLERLNEKQAQIASAPTSGKTKVEIASTSHSTPIEEKNIGQEMLNDRTIDYLPLSPLFSDESE